MSTTYAGIPFKSSALAMCTAGAMLCATLAPAAEPGLRSPSRSLYEADRAACMNGSSNQDRATCLREAGAARDEAARGRLDDGQGRFEQNRLLRCDNQPPQDRADCLRRMNGEGTTTGSVEGGGIYRELVTPVIPAQRN